MKRMQAELALQMMSPEAFWQLLKTNKSLVFDLANARPPIARILANSITTEEKFIEIMNADTPLALKLAKEHPHIAKLLSLQFFQWMCKNPLIDQNYAKELVEIAVVGNIIKNEQIFVSVCKANIYLAGLLAQDHRFSTFAKNSEQYAHFDHLSSTYGIGEIRQQKRLLKRPA